MPPSGALSDCVSFLVMFYLYWCVFQCDIYFDSEYSDDISYFGDHGVVIMF